MLEEVRDDLDPFVHPTTTTTTKATTTTTSSISSHKASTTVKAKGREGTGASIVQKKSVDNNNGSKNRSKSKDDKAEEEEEESSSSTTTTTTTESSSSSPSLMEIMEMESCSNKKEDSKLKLNFTLDKDIDYSIPPKCGNRKCFFQSTWSNKIGYIIAKIGYQRILQMSWENSCGFLARGNHQHIYTRIPPITLSLSTHQHTQFLNNLDDKRGREVFGNSQQLVVLQVKHIRPRSSWAEVNLKKQPRYIEELYTVLTRKGDNNVNNDTLSPIIQKYLLEIDKVVQLIYEIPRMVHDYQMMVLEDGSIVHYDLDRIGESPKVIPPRELWQCICDIKKDSILIKYAHQLKLQDYFQQGKLPKRDLYTNNKALFEKEIEECTVQSSQQQITTTNRHHQAKLVSS